MLFAATNATGNTILSLDDPSVSTDQGSAFTAYFKSSGFDTGPATGFGTLRRLVQAITVNGPVTMVLTPIGDGSEYTGQAATVSIATTDGPMQEVEVPVFVAATRFQVKCAITAHTGQTELGESDQWFVIRRQIRKPS